MNIIFRAFERLRQAFDNVATPTPTTSSSVKLDVILKSINSLNERIDKMAVSLDGLSREVERAKQISEGATTMIDKLLTDVRAISDELVVARAAAENVIDTAVLDSLIATLKQSTDTLEGTLKK